MNPPGHGCGGNAWYGNGQLRETPIREQIGSERKNHDANCPEELYESPGVGPQFRWRLLDDENERGPVYSLNKTGHQL